MKHTLIGDQSRVVTWKLKGMPKQMRLSCRSNAEAYAQALKRLPKSSGYTEIKIGKVA